MCRESNSPPRWTNPWLLCLVFFVDSRGRKPTQFMGYVVLTILFAVNTVRDPLQLPRISYRKFCVGFAYYDTLTATPAATMQFSVLYCLADFWAAFVFLEQTFSIRYCTTADGISAAMIGLENIVTQVGFTRLVDIGGTNKFVKHMYVSRSLPLYKMETFKRHLQLRIVAFTVSS